jgi:hypothetical protein
MVAAADDSCLLGGATGRLNELSGHHTEAGKTVDNQVSNDVQRAAAHVLITIESTRL